MSRNDPVTFSDRCIFGAIAAVAGLLVGSVVAVVLFYQHPQQSFNRSLLVFSVAYFFFAGFALRERAADLLAGAVQAGLQEGRHELNPRVRPQPEQETIASDTVTLLVAVGYVLGAIALVYLG